MKFIIIHQHTIPLLTSTYFCRMNAVIISIGDEILNGTTINTNASWIATQIQPLGINIHEIISVADKKDHILQTLERYSGTVGLIFITGGLGPTKDDITKNTLCSFFSSQLQFHEDIYLRLKKAFERRNIPFTENNRDQAMYPDNCIIIQNDLGTAQGMWFEKNNSIIISMPGVPFEMKGMMTDRVIPKLSVELKLPFIINKHLMTSGMSESLLAEKIEGVENKLPAYISLAYLPSPGVVKLRLTAKGADRSEMENEVEAIAAELKQVLQNAVYADEVLLPEEYIGRLLTRLNATLSTAESCTGGKIAHKITSVPGSSNYYTGSCVTYSYDLKSDLLGVKPDTLVTYGAVSAETVSEMLTGALTAMNTDFAIAVSGIAGPAGGTADKPVGTVYIGVGDRQEQRVKKYLFNKNREVNIEYTCMFALHELRLLLEERIEKKPI